MSREELIEELRLEEKLECRKCEDEYYYFLKCGWDVLEYGTELVDNWHIKYLCDIFQKEIERIAARLPKEQDIIINISPRSLKSYIVSIMLVPWAWIKYPWLRFINTSFSTSLSTEHCVKSRQLIDSEWYQGHWGDRYKMTTDQNTKGYFVNNFNGARIAGSVSGGVTGRGADMVIADDILDVMDGNSEIERDKANFHWDKSLTRRLNDHHVGLMVNIQQRIHEEDTTGHLLSKNPQKYMHICIPMEEDENVSPPELIEFYEDGLFFPTRFNRQDVDEIKTDDDLYSGQYQQRPSPKGGKIIQKDWFGKYRRRELPETFDMTIQSWDFTFKGESQSRSKPKNGRVKIDYVVGLVMARKGTKIYIIDRFRAKADIKTSIEGILRFCEFYPDAHNKYFEDKANGPAIQTFLNEKIFGVQMVEPMGSKLERLMAIKHLIQGGHVLVPHEDDCDWSTSFINEFATFPLGTYDDQVDAATQGLLKIEEASGIIEKYKLLLG